MTAYEVLQYVTGGVVIAVLLVALWRDVEEFRIPNWIHVVIMGAYLLETLAGSRGLYDVLWDCSMATVVLLIGFALYSISVLGAGDVKLMIALGLFLTYELFVEFIQFTVFIGGVLALLILVLRYARDLVPAGRAYTEWIERFRAYMPYGVAIAAAGIALIPVRWGWYAL